MGSLWSNCCGADSDSDQGESGERTRLIRWVVATCGVRAVWRIRICGIHIISLDPDPYKKWLDPESGSVFNDTIKNRK